MSDSVAAKPNTARALNVALWVLQVAAAGMLALSGFSKLSGAQQMVSLFEAIGFGQWFRYLTGGLEVLGAGLLVLPALSGVGAVMLVGVMAGAVATHLFRVGGSPAPAGVLLVVLGLVAYGRRDRITRLLAR